MGPLMLEVGRNPNIVLHVLSEVVGVSGQIGDFKVDILQKPTYVNIYGGENSCNGCGACFDVCPATRGNEFDYELSATKAIYTAFAQAVPAVAVIDGDACIKCGNCQKVCEQHAIRLDDEPRTETVTVGTIIVATGWDEYKPEVGEYGYGVYENVVTQGEFERILAPNGPYLGHFKRPSDGKTPKSMLFVQCVGSRSLRSNAYCSAGVCCMISIKNSKLVKQHDPSIDVDVAYIDIRAAGKEYEEYFRSSREYGVRYIPSSVHEVKELPDKSLEVTLDIEGPVKKRYDMVVLSCALQPSTSIPALNSILKLERSVDGFFKEFHSRLDPINAKVPGIAFAGVAQGPKSIAESIMQARGAASSLGTIMHAGQYDIELIKAFVDSDRCSKCQLCEFVCPFGAISMTPDEGVAVVDEILCRGCGNCVSICPSAAVDLRNYKEDQYFALIDHVFETPSCEE
ncbi:MAG: 4Fe-4S binding protein [Promethearchaeota archaeon]